MAIIGIDLGTTNSLVSVYKDNESILIPNAFGEYITPSVVSVDENENIIVGKLAKERLITHPNESIANFKRFMGTDTELKLGKKSYNAEELSSFVLRKLVDDAREYLQEEIEEIVVSVPAYFNDDQRWATKTAGKLAGIYIERIINEPSAAALTLHQSHRDDCLYMVIDFGGGTLDISIVDAFDNIIEIVAVSGDNKLGGEDFNQEIAKYFLAKNNMSSKDLTSSELELLYKEIEKAKRILNEKEQVTIEVNINNLKKTCLLTYRGMFSICKSLLARMDGPIQKVLKDAVTKVDVINDVILVGGSCKMRMVQEYIEYLLRREVKVGVSPDSAIALGCGIVAGIKERNESIKDVLLTDICPFTLGISIFDGSFSPIIERNSILPCSKVQIYQTVQLGQKEITGKIYQGENRIAEKNIEVASFSIEVPVNMEDYEKISVRFTYDINGILEVDVLSLTTGKKEKLVVVSKSSHMDENQIQKRLKELQSLKMHPREEEKNKYLLEKADILFMDLTGEERKEISLWASEFQKSLDSQDDRIIKKAFQIFEKQLDSKRTLILDISEDASGYLS